MLEDLLRCEMTEISHEGYENVEGDDGFVACGMLTLRWNPLGNWVISTLSGKKSCTLSSSVTGFASDKFHFWTFSLPESMQVTTFNSVEEILWFETYPILLSPGTTVFVFFSILTQIYCTTHFDVGTYGNKIVGSFMHIYDVFAILMTEKFNVSLVSTPSAKKNTLPLLPFPSFPRQHERCWVEVWPGVTKIFREE